MMREVVGAITGVFIALYMMYFFIPLLSTEHTQFNQVVNVTDPTVITSYNLGGGYYQVIPLIPIIVAVFILINVALKREAGE